VVSRRTKKELEQLLAAALEEKDQQTQTIRDLNVSIESLLATVQDLRHELENSLADNYRGIEGARRWLAEHIGYDLRQVAKCPTCLGISTTPTNPEKIGARFRCKNCGQIFFIVKVLSTDPMSIRQAVRDAQYEAAVDISVDPEPVVVLPRQLTSGRK
jgi:hypothetical protein